MKTQGEIEAAICEGIAHFEQQYMGRGPKDIHAHLIGDLLVVRLKGVLTAAEQQLVKTVTPEKGRDLLKASANSANRNRAAGFGSHDRKSNRRQDDQHAPRYQHRDG